MDLSIKLTSSLDEIDARRWNALSPHSFRFSHEWFRNVDSGPFDAESVFCVAEEDGAGRS